MDIIVFLLSLAGLIFTWRALARKMAGSMWIVRHIAGAICGMIVMSFIVGVSQEIGIIEPAKTKPAQAAAKTEPKEEKYEYENMLLSEYMEESKGDRIEIAEEFVKVKNLPDSANAAFHRCLSDMSRNKSKELTVGKVIEWCLHDYKNEPKSMAKYINYDAFEEQFGVWNGAHFALERFIKMNMNDPDSYEHDKTTYRIVATDTERYAVISTTFRGKNGFGGTVRNTVVAKTNIDTGDIIEILEKR